MSWAYGSNTAIALTLTSLGNSATLVAGRQSESIDLSASNFDDVIIGLNTMSIATPAPTAGGFIELWWIPQLPDGSWPDTFEATDANRTVSSRAELAGYGHLLRAVQNSAATAHPYDLIGYLVGAGGSVHYSKIGCLWVTQSTGQALHGTAGSHSASYMGMTRS